jgi:hypothetical protein
MFEWIKSKLFTCLIRECSFYYIKQIDTILPLSVHAVIDTQYDVIMWEEHRSDPLASAARGHFFVLPTL